MAGKLILTRKGTMINRRQQFKVLIDGVEAGKIKNDDTEEFALATGTHTIQCKVNWMSSQVETFQLHENGNTYLSVSSGMKFIVPLYIMMLAGLFIPFFFTLAKSPVPAIINTLKAILVFPTLVYLILYMSILRKKYLVISDDKTNPFK